MKPVETNTVEETVEKTKLPIPIKLKTKSGEYLVMKAITNTQYTKCYYAEPELGEPLSNPRRAKLVNLPVVVNGKRYFYTYPLFIELVENGKYKRGWFGTMML